MSNEGTTISELRWRRLRVAAWVAFATHLLAGLAMLTVLRNGLETNPVFIERAKYIADHVGLWRLAWFTWSIAALAILYFFASFVWAHHPSSADRADARRFALLLATVAVAADLAAEAIEIGVLPGLAQRVVADNITDGGNRSLEDHFCAAHRTNVMLSGYLANGLYSVTALILALGTRSRYPKWVWWSGMGVTMSCGTDFPLGIPLPNLDVVP